MKLGKTSLNGLAKLRPDSVKRRRESSYDRTGDNYDWLDVKAGEKVILAEVEGAGMITHIWCTMTCRAKHYLRNIIIRFYWDGESEDTPSVEAPIGDFFGMGHAKRENFVSLPLQMSPQGGRGFNCWWTMPFLKGFKITLENDTDTKYRIYYYIDYELHENGLEKEVEYGRFHAQWRRENPPLVKNLDDVTGKKLTPLHPIRFNLFGTKNTEPLKYNYRILEARGKGHYVGCNLNIDNRTFMPWFINWPGEGDDMIFIDEDIEKKVPTLFGTGTEDYVNQAFCPRERQSAPYHGTIRPGGFNWHGKITYYRYHVEDPIYFNKQIIVSIEHGHDNHRADDFSSTAYWYQKEPHDHSLYPALLPREKRMPLSSVAHTIRKASCLGVILVLLIWIYLMVILMI